MLLITIKMYNDYYIKWFFARNAYVNMLSFLAGISKSGTLDYQAAHTLILAHARAYRLYERKYKATQKGNQGRSGSYGYVSA